MARARFNRPKKGESVINRKLVVGKGVNPGAKVRVVGGNVDAAIFELWGKRRGRKR